MMCPRWEKAGSHHPGSQQRAAKYSPIPDSDVIYGTHFEFLEKPGRSRPNVAKLPELLLTK
jgi:hypothetical protein